MKHICTLVISGQEWKNVANLVSEQLGEVWTFDITKRYTIQNLSNEKIMLVSSAEKIGNDYNEGNIILPFEYFNYYPSSEDLYIRYVNDIMNYTVTINEEKLSSGGDSSEILAAISNVSDEVNAIDTKIGNVETQLSEV